MKKLTIVFGSVFWVCLSGVYAGEADVIKAEAQKTGKGTYSFSVTVLHDDKGWGHYANKWDVMSKAGAVLGTRILHHPHVDEQPFTRRLSGVKIPGGVTTVFIRAHDSVHKYGGKVISVDLPR